MYDLHTHSTNSDGKYSVDDMCRAALEKGLRGIALTDHADMYVFEERDTLNKMTQAGIDLRAAKEAYRGKLQVFFGVELGEYLMAPDKAEQILTLNDYDVVLYSEHFVPAAKWDKSYNRIVCDESVSDEDIHDYMKLYFDLLNDTVTAFDYDVLAHISCPARYITGRQKRATNVMLYEKTITEILKKIIDRDIALEWNTCGKCCESFGYYDAQNEEIFQLYRALGGSKVTLGSDAHNVGGIGRGFAETKAQLKAMGFDNYYYYENRKAVAVKL